MEINQLEIKDLKQLVNEHISEDNYLIKQVRDDYELVIEMKLEELVIEIKHSEIVLNENQSLNIK